MAESSPERLVGTWDIETFVEGRWEASPGGTAWNLDLPITYCKTS